MPEEFSVHAMFGKVSLYHDRLVCRKLNGKLLRRLTANETLCFVETALGLLQRRDFARSYGLPGSDLRIDGFDEGADKLFATLIISEGNSATSLPLSTESLSLLRLVLRLNVGVDEFENRKTRLGWSEAEGKFSQEVTSG